MNISFEIRSLLSFVPLIFLAIPVIAKKDGQTVFATCGGQPQTKKKKKNRMVVGTAHGDER